MHLLHLQLVQTLPYPLLVSNQDERALGRAAFRALTDNMPFAMPNNLSAGALAALQVSRMLHVPALFCSVP